MNVSDAARGIMEIAKQEAQQSNDDRTKVGAVVFKILGKGYNCMPMEQDSDFPWLTRKKARRNDTYGIASEHKHLYVCHAELNAIVNAYKSSADLQGSSICVTLNPCNDCAKLIVQAGIKEVFYIERRNDDTFNAARRMFDTIGVKYTQIQ